MQNITDAIRKYIAVNGLAGLAEVLEAANQACGKQAGDWTTNVMETPDCADSKVEMGAWVDASEALASLTSNIEESVSALGY